MTTYTGSAARDLYTGGNADDTIAGLGGDDKLAGAGGDDWVVGGTGADVLDGGVGDDTLFGGEEYPGFGYPYSIFYLNDPVLDTGSQPDTLTGGAGDDRIFAGYNDTADGGADTTYGDNLYLSLLGADAGVTLDFTKASVANGAGTLRGFEAIPWLQGSEFDDTITLYSSTPYAPFDVVYAMGGDDRITADYHTDRLFGGDGDDVLDGRPSGYLSGLDGGAGNDTLLSGTMLGTISGGDGDDTIEASSGAISGGAGDDLITLRYSGYGASVDGGDGDDEIHAAEEGVTAAGGAGADLLIGGDGADTLSSAGRDAADAGIERDTLSGGAGGDRLSAGYGDLVDGGAGRDTLSLSLLGSSAGVRMATDAITAGGFTLGGGAITGVETLHDLTATAFADRITLSSANNVTVHGMAGNDTFTTGTVSATLFGGEGDDVLVSGAAADRFDGGAGIDTVDYSASTRAVSFALGEGASTGAGGDTLIGVEAVRATRFADELVGNSATNRFEGAGGGDRLSGAGGDDRLEGGAGRDVLDGGSGDDDLFGGADKDILTGGAGRDVFHFEEATVARTLVAADTITDFRQADKDKLSFAAVDGVAGPEAVDPFTFIGKAAFSGAAGELRFAFAGKTTIVSADTDGDGAADVFVRLDGHVALEARDFVFARAPAVALDADAHESGGWLARHPTLFADPHVAFA